MHERLTGNESKMEKISVFIAQFSSTSLVLTLRHMKGEITMSQRDFLLLEIESKTI